MRQRNVKNKNEIINSSSYIVLDIMDHIGKWNEVFNNDNPIYIEIGMGKGNFILENAKKYPNVNFIGIEKSDSIIALALKKMDKEKISNLRVIRMDARNIESVFFHEIDKIYLNFSDPWQKSRHANRRLTSPIFLNKYNKLFKNVCSIEMKTDNQNLFEYSLISFTEAGYKIMEISLDLHNTNCENNIMTEYEQKFSSLNNNIYYVKVVKSS